MADTERDHFMSAEEAKAYGIIDAVMQKRGKDTIERINRKRAAARMIE